MIRSSRAIRFDGNGYSEEWRAEAARRGLDCETCAPRVFDRYLDPSSVEMFARMGVLSKVELEARTEVKWETYTKKIQIEGRVLGDLTRTTSCRSLRVTKLCCWIRSIRFRKSDRGSTLRPMSNSSNVFSSIRL